MTTSWRKMRSMLDSELLLKRMGLEQRTPTGDFFTGLGLFSVGMLVGAGLGLLFAPRRGEDTRASLQEAWRNRTKQMGPDYQSMGSEAAMPPPASGH
jgi:hypothetical protein